MKKILVIIMSITIIALIGCSQPNPGKFLPHKCQVASGFMCKDIAFEGNQITFSLLNNGMGDLNDLSISIVGCSSVNGASALSNGQSSTYTADCSIVSGERFKGELTISYTVQGSEQTQKGEVEINTNLK